MASRDRITRRRFLSIAAATSAGAALAACAPATVSTPPPVAGTTVATTAPAAQEGGTLVWTDATDGSGIVTWLPWKQWSTTMQFHWQQCFSQLVGRDKKNAIFTPDLAESWEINPDGTIYTFHLRNGVKWHDGTPFTAKDVAFTYHAALLPEAGSTLSPSLVTLKGAQDFQNKTTETAEGIQVLDDQTIQFEFTQPYYGLMYGVFSSLFIAPAHPFEGISDPAEWLKTPFATDVPIGTGPFVFKEYVPGQYSILERNEDYWRGHPKLDQVLARFYADVDVALIALETGEVNATQLNINADQHAKIKAMPNILIEPTDRGAAVFLSMSFKPPFGDVVGDKRVRQAVMYAIDRQAISNTLFGEGLATPAVVSQWITPAYISPNLNTYAYDPEKAKALLAEAGWDPNVELTVPARGTTTSAEMELILSQLADVGIKTKVELMESTSFFGLWESGDYHLLRLGGWGALQPWGAINIVGCGMEQPTGENSMRYCNPEMDSLLNEAYFTEPDEAKRAALFQQASEIFNDELPYLPMWVPITQNIWHSSIKGRQDFAGSDYWENRWDMWDWYVE